MSDQVNGCKDFSLDELRDVIGPKPFATTSSASIFGSRARGDNDENSDYDFIILCPEDMGLIGLTNFRNELIKVLDRPVDFAYEDYISTGFDSVVGQDKVLVYEE